MEIPEVSAHQTRKFAGDWTIISQPDFDDVFEEGGESPHMSLKASQYSTLSGDYGFGLASGMIDDVVREFGGQQILIFGYESSDEMDQVSSGGWARINEKDELEGEFLGVYGPFVAKRKRSKRK